MPNPTIQERAPLSAFPDTVISVPKITAPTTTQLGYIVQYNEAIAVGDLATAQAILAAHPDLESCRISTTDYNRIIDEIKATQILFNEEITTYIAAHINIDDSAPAVDRAYSSTKTETLVGTLEDNNERELTATLLASGWETSGGYYIQTINVAGITNTQRPLIDVNKEQAATWKQQKDWVKELSYINYYDTADNRITFTAKFKCPTLDIPIVLKGI